MKQRFKKVKPLTYWVKDKQGYREAVRDLCYGHRLHPQQDYLSDEALDDLIWLTKGSIGAPDRYPAIVHFDPSHLGGFNFTLSWKPLIPWYEKFYKWVLQKLP